MPDVMTVDVMETRLQAWAAWMTGGKCDAGYPCTNVLHPSWMPPAPGQTPTLKSVPQGAGRMERELHQAIQTLSIRLQNTLVVVYLMRAGTAERVTLLDCQESTVRARVAEAKARIARKMDEGVLPVIATR